MNYPTFIIIDDRVPRPKSLDEIGLSQIVDARLERGMIQIRSSGPLTGKAFFLNDAYDWKVGLDDAGMLVLVALRK